MTVANSAESNQQRLFEFGDYTVNLDSFELRCQAASVSVEPQVFALLAYLIQHRERLVSKDELLDELWGHRYVSESALSTQVKSLRKAVGDDGRNQRVIQTVRGRGYRFVAQLNATPSRPATRPPTSSRMHNLPRERTHLFGREQDVVRCRELLGRNRLITILGIGGTGKTRLGARVAREALDDFADGVWFVDLIPLAGINSLETAVADALGLALDAGPTRPQLIEALRERQLLLVLDNCEHLKADAADLINDLLEFTRTPKFIATSRDPLNLLDEYRFYLDPLATSCCSGVAPAVALFQATAARHGVGVNTSDMDEMTRLCEQLDGLPLALELAAAQLRHLTLAELGTRLQQRFEVLAGRERTPSGRQTNLLAVLEDTWHMLNTQEQQCLGQLATFPAEFSVTGVEEVLTEVPSASLSAAFSRLVDLGLIQRTSKEGAWWRVLETVRFFTLQRFPAEQIRANASRHARWCQRKLGDFPQDQLDNLKQAEWCLHHYADLETAEQFLLESNELTGAYAICTGTGLMVQLDDGARAREKLQRAQAYLAAVPPPYWRARLHAIAGLCAQANRSPEMLLLHTDAFLDLAQSLDDPPLHANALLMKSLTTGFVDAGLARAQLSQMIEIGQRLNNGSLIDAGKCFTAWQYAVGRDYARALSLALDIVRRFDRQPSDIDNPAYNAIGIIVTCTIVDEPHRAAGWAARLPEFPAVSSFWGIQNLLACVEASCGEFTSCAARCLEVKSRLNRATRDEFPDLLVTAAMLAYRHGDTRRAQKWLSAIRHGRIPIQMYHMISIYRQLYDRLGFGVFGVDNTPGLDDVRREVTAWLQDLADRQST